MKAFFYRLSFLFCGLCSGLLLSCAARIDGSLAADGSAVMSVNVSLETGMTSLIRRLKAAGGQTGDPVLDGQSIAQSMSNKPGVARVSFTNTASSALDGTVQISNINEFLAVGGFIKFEQGRTGGSCEINISRDNGPAILAMLSLEISDYLETLMAPLVTGEDLNKAGYLAEVTSIYGRTVSNEIAGSRIRVSIDFPGTVTSVRGGTFSGRRVNFDIPVLDLLVLETPLSYNVMWN